MDGHGSGSSGARRMVARVELLLVACFLPLAACKKGDPLSIESTSVRADFVEASGGGTSGSVTLRKGVVHRQRIWIDVTITDVAEPVAALALKFTYPSTFSEFLGCADGDLFTMPGTCYSAEPEKGTVFVARTIVAPEQPVAVTGTKTIVRLQFLVFGESEGDLIIQAPNIGGGDASAVLNSNGNPILLQWFSGTLKGE